MARKKQIEDDVLIDLIKRYYNEVCHGNGSLMKYPNIAKYVSENGYPGYAAYTLRRNTAARAYIDSLAGDVKKASSYITTYSTMDVEAFISNNPTHESLKRALTERDMYYRNVCEAAIVVKGENKNLTEQIEKQNAELEALKKEHEELKERCSVQKAELSRIRKENSSMKSFIEDNVYPEMANELLKADGELKGDVTPHINEDKANAGLIRPDTKINTDDEDSADDKSDESTDTSGINSNVVKGIFDKFK